MRRRPPPPRPACGPRSRSRRLDAEIEFLARALLAETDGASLRGIEALAACTMNRLRAMRRLAPDISLAALVRREHTFPAGIRSPRATEAVAFAACRRIASRAIAGVLADATRGATRWHRAGAEPAWAEGRAPRHLAGGWVFYGEGWADALLAARAVTRACARHETSTSSEPTTSSQPIR